MHHTRQALDERHRHLEDLRRRSVGEAEQPRACRVCYAVYDKAGCMCGRDEWVPIGVLVVELSLLIEALDRHSKVCTSALDGLNCVHCLAA